MMAWMNARSLRETLATGRVTYWARSRGAVWGQGGATGAARQRAEGRRESLAAGRGTYWSRSRGALWRKGETSGHDQQLVELRLDCDRDCLLLIVDQTGPACHTNRRSCFFTAVRGGMEATTTEPASGTVTSDF